MKRVFVGFAFGADRESELLSISKSGLQNASNQYQHGFINGLSDPDLTIFSSLCVGLFPRLNKRLFFRQRITQMPYGKLVYFKFINLPFLKEKMFERQLWRALSRMAKDNRGEPIELFIYSLYIPFLNVLKKLKNKYPKAFRSFLIIPDLPGKYGIMRKRFSLRGIKDRLEIKKKMCYANLTDNFVFLTESMKTLFDPKPYVVIEGFLPSCDFRYDSERQKKTILYTGSLNRNFGVATLIDAFALIEDVDYRLWICGAGDGQGEVEVAAARDPRILFKGFLPKNEIADLQSRCDVLINPRPAEGVFTKYSFPSKTMEYLLSGSKVVMHKLEGVGEEYYRYIRVIDEHSPEGIARAILSAVSDETFYPQQCMEQVSWIASQKSCRAQVEKLKDL